MAKTVKTTPLGKGLSALLGDDSQILPPSSVARIKTDTNGYIRIESIEANPYQPRTDFEEQTLEELSISIKTYGLIQPVTVRPANNGKYQLISGERRFRASKMAGLQSIPAYVKEVSDDAAVEMMALIENIQREDLNALEIALSFQKLIEEYKLTQDQLSDKVGKKRATVSNYLRLLRLPAAIQIALKNKQLDMGHARALISINEPSSGTRYPRQPPSQKALIPLFLPQPYPLEIFSCNHIGNCSMASAYLCIFFALMPIS